MYECPDNRPCLNESAIEDLQAALAKLIYFITSGERYEQRNPYLIPVVKAALKELMQSMGRGDGDYLDALEVFERTFPDVDVRGQNE